MSMSPTTTSRVTRSSPTVISPGAVDDARLLVDVGFRVLQATAWPEWKAASNSNASNARLFTR